MAVLSGLYRRGKNWYVDVTVDGQRIRKSFGDNKLQAQAAVNEIKKQRSMAGLG